jgi:hypothetical protein
MKRSLSGRKTMSKFPKRFHDKFTNKMSETIILRHWEGDAIVLSLLLREFLATMLLNQQSRLQWVSWLPGGSYSLYFCFDTV